MPNLYRSLLCGRILKLTFSCFSGHWESGFRHGFGIQFYKDGTIFEGNWLYGKRHGWGRLTEKCPEDDTEQKKKSKSKKKADASSQLPRSFMPEKPDYPIVFRTSYPKSKKAPKCTRYEGSFRNGVKHGPGTLILANGDMFEGEWCGEQREGEGRYWFAEKDVVIVGRWKEDMLVNGLFLKASDFVKTLREGAEEDVGEDKDVRLPRVSVSDVDGDVENLI